MSGYTLKSGKVELVESFWCPMHKELHRFNTTTSQVCFIQVSQLDNPAIRELPIQYRDYLQDRLYTFESRVLKLRYVEVTTPQQFRQDTLLGVDYEQYLKEMQQRLDHHV